MEKNTNKELAATSGVKRVVEDEKYWNELVDFYAFKDNGKYKDDIFVSVNEKTYKIKRGETVKVPRNVFKVLQRSMNQDANTANLMDEQSNAFVNEVRTLG